MMKSHEVEGEEVDEVEQEEYEDEVLGSTQGAQMCFSVSHHVVEADRSVVTEFPADRNRQKWSGRLTEGPN